MKAFYCVTRVQNAFCLQKYIKRNVRLLTTSLMVSRSSDDTEKESYVVRKVNELNEWYIKLTGLDEVKKAQERVITTQEKLEKAQEERRAIGKLLMDVRNKSNELQEDLEKTKRWEDMEKYLDLRRQESEIIKSEKELTTKFEILDKSERDIFSALSNAVRDSHEKEKAQAQHTKYWGIILSVIGTLVGAVGSSILSNIRNKQMVAGITDSLDVKLQTVTQLVDQKNAWLHMAPDDIANAIVTSLDRNQKAQINALSQLFTNLYANICDDNKKSLGAILENKKNIESILHRIKVGYVISSDSIVKGDEILDVNASLNAQKHLLEEHQSKEAFLLTPTIFVAFMAFLCICIGCACR